MILSFMERINEPIVHYTAEYMHWANASGEYENLKEQLIPL